MMGAAAGLQRELRRWREREASVREALRAIEDDETRLVEELPKVDAQVAYYDALARDMKREIGRPGLSTILRSLRR